jgi:hypothetical protein
MEVGAAFAVGRYRFWRMRAFMAAVAPANCARAAVSAASRV